MTKMTRSVNPGRTYQPVATFPTSFATSRMDDDVLDFPDELPVGQLLMAVSTKPRQPAHDLTVKVPETTTTSSCLLGPPLSTGAEDKNNPDDERLMDQPASSSTKLLTGTELFPPTTDDAAALAATVVDLVETPTAAAASASSGSTTSRQVEALSTCLRDSHQQKRSLLEQVCADKQVWEGQLQAVVASAQQSEILAVQHATELRHELEQQHAVEVERLEAEKEASIVQASRMASKLTNEYYHVRTRLQQQALATKHQLREARQAHQDVTQQLEAALAQVHQLESERSILIPELERQLSDLQARLQSELRREQQRTVQLEDELLEALDHIELLEDFEEEEISRQDEIIGDLKFNNERLTQELQDAQASVHTQSECRLVEQLQKQDLVDLTQRLLIVASGLLMSKLGENTVSQDLQTQLQSDTTFDIAALQAKVQLVESLHAQMVLDEALDGPGRIPSQNRTKTAPFVSGTQQSKTKVQPHHRNALKASRMSLAPSFKPDTTPRPRVNAPTAATVNKENATNVSATKAPSTSSKPVVKRSLGPHSSSSAPSALPTLRGSALKKPPGTSHLTRPTVGGKPRSRLEKYGTTTRSGPSALTVPQLPKPSAKGTTRAFVTAVDDDRTRAVSAVKSRKSDATRTAPSSDESLGWCNVGRPVSTLDEAASATTSQADPALLWSNVGRPVEPAASEPKTAPTSEEGSIGWRNVGRYLPKLGCEAGNSDEPETESKTSPKILIKNVLQALSPKASAASASVPTSPGEQPFVPVETIEMTPCEPKVERKFDSLYSSWSTSRYPEASGSPAEHSHVLRIQFSTIKKTKREDPTTATVMNSTAAPPTRKRLKRDDPMLETPARRTGERMALLDDPANSLVQATPLFVRGELVSLFSPEELLLSPFPTAKASVQAGMKVNPTTSKLRPTFHSVLASPQESLFLSQAVVDGMTKHSVADMENRGAQEREEATTAQFQSHIALQRHRKKRMAVITLQRWMRRLVETAETDRKLSQSCRRIQGAWRTRVARNLVLRQRNLAVQLQALVRQYLARQRFKVLQCEHHSKAVACQRIQAAWRGHPFLLKYRQLRGSTLFLQAVFRGLLARKIYTAKVVSRISHATTIQQFWRQIRARRNFIKVQSASIILQSVWRGTRRRLELRSAKLLSKVKACIQLQKSWRSYYMHHRYCQMRGVVVCLQGFYRIKLARRKLCSLQISRCVNSGATQIQRIWRGTNAQKRHIELVCACMIIQSVWRGATCRGIIRSTRTLERSTGASTKIQRVWRARFARVQFTRLQKSTIFVQCAFRRKLARHRSERLREMVRRAITIQRNWRYSSTRRKYIELFCATIVLQSMWRGYCHRRALQVWIISEKSREAATKVKCVWRSRVSRKRFATFLQNVVLVQSFVRRVLARSTAQRLVTARRDVQSAIIVQKSWRCCSSRNKYIELLCASMIVQSVWRGTKVRLEIECMMHARLHQRSTVTIQKNWRSKKARNRLKRLQMVVCVQRLTRRLLARRRLAIIKAFREETKGAIRIQKCWRSSAARKTYVDLLCASKIVQSVWRGYLGRRQIQQILVNKLRVLSTLRIQRCWRSHASRVDYIRTRKSVIIAQSLARQQLARNQVSILKSLRKQDNSIIRIQSRWRAFCAEQEFGKVCYSARIVQSSWRLMRTRRQVKRRIRSRQLDRSSLTIQTNWRSYFARQHFCRSRSLVILVQCMVRRTIARNVLVCYKAILQQGKGAVVIQQQWRRFRAQRDYQDLVQAVRTLQFLWLKSSLRRKMNAQRILQEKSTAAVVVQKCWRSHSAQCLFGRNVRHILRLQALVRRMLACTRVVALVTSRRNTCAIIIQKHWRCALARKFHVRLVRGTVKLQLIWRCLANKQVLRSMIQSTQENASAIALQKTWRSRTARLHFTLQRKAIVVLQKYGRRATSMRKLEILRAKHRLLELSATQLQRCVRSTTARKKFLFFKQSAVKIQSQWRSFAKRSAFAKARCAVHLLQAFARRHLARAVWKTEKGAALKQSTAAVCMQRYWRGFKQYRRYLALSRVAMERNRVEALALTPVGSTTTRSTRVQHSAQPVEGTARRSKRNPHSSDLSSAKNAKRLPFGDVEAGGKGGTSSQLNTRYRTPKPLKFPGGTKTGAPQLDNFKSREDIERLKVVELRELLVQQGVEKKLIRPLRKAELVTMVMERGQVVE